MTAKEYKEHLEKQIKMCHIRKTYIVAPCFIIGLIGASYASVAQRTDLVLINLGLCVFHALNYWFQEHFSSKLETRLKDLNRNESSI